MKRRALLTAMLAAPGLAACGSGTGGGEGGTTTFRVASNWSESHPMAQVIDEVFKPAVEEKSGGTLAVEVFHAGVLGNEADLWNGARNGTIDMVIVGTPMNQEYPKMLISDWPFLYRDLSHAQKVWTGDIAEQMSADFHEKFPETYILGWGPNSARTFSSNKELTSVAEFEGQKFRMPSNPIHVGLAESLGASAQVIPLGDLFTSLETGVVDGQDNGMVTIISEGFYEVQDYVHETNHIVATLELIANAGFLDGLSEDEQQIIRDASKEAATEAWERYGVSIEEDRAFLEENGVTVTQPTDEDRQLMEEKTQPLVESLYAEHDWAEELTQQIRDVN